MNQELYDIINKLIEINEKQYIIIKSKFNNIVKNNIQDEHTIETILDELLDILYTYSNQKICSLYMKICLYYYNINPENADDYYQFYLETLDNDSKNNKIKVL